MPSAQPAVPLTWPLTDERPASGVRAASGATRRVLLAGVGYRDLRDFSVGPVLVERLRRQAWPPGVEVEDLSSGAVHVLHWLQAQPPFDAAVFVAAVERGREPGCVHAYAWTAPTDTAEGVQQRIAEAVTGVIGLDTLLVVLGYFGALPPRVSVIEVEPRDEAWGESFSPPVEAALDEVSRLVRRQVEALVA